MEMDCSRLDEVLTSLGELLEHDGLEPIHLVVSGGAALLQRGIIARSTHDVDVLATRGNVDLEISPAHPLPPSFVAAIEDIAERKGLARNWVNASTSLLMIPLGCLPSDIWEDLSEREYGKCLTVSFIGRIGLIYLKTCAVSNREETRDRSDLELLAPTDDEIVSSILWLMKEELFPPGQSPRLRPLLEKIGYEHLLHRFS